MRSTWRRMVISAEVEGRYLPPYLKRIRGPLPWSSADRSDIEVLSPEMALHGASSAGSPPGCGKPASPYRAGGPDRRNLRVGTCVCSGVLVGDLGVEGFPWVTRRAAGSTRTGWSS